MKDDLFWAKGGLAQGELQRQQLSQTTTSHGRAPNHFKVRDICVDGWVGKLEGKVEGGVCVNLKPLCFHLDKILD